MTYLERLQRRDEIVNAASNDRVILIPWKLVYNDAELQHWTDIWLSQGYEGTVLRDPNARYKEGRSTSLEGGFLRYCPWLYSEMVLTGYKEAKENTNEKVTNELGRSKRATNQENMKGKGFAGAFIGYDLKTNIEFSMTIPKEDLGRDVWENWPKYDRQLAKYRCKPAVKIGGAPRFPQFEGIRDPDDMS
jgi:DNA ligase 1